MTKKKIGIGFGTWAWGNKLVWGYKAETDNILLKKTFFDAIDGGLDLVDSADSYGTGSLFGQSEKLIGDFLEELPKRKLKKITIATKLAPFPWRIGRNGLNNAFQESNQRLKGNMTRVQLHWSTYRYAPWQEEQLLNGLGDLYEEGLIKEIGLSNTGPKRLIFLFQKLKKRGIKIKSIQMQLSLLTKPSLEDENIKIICDENEIEYLAYSPLGLGILTVPPNQSPKPKTLLRQILFQTILPKTIELRTLLSDIAKKYSASQAQVALNWVRSHGAKPIVGIRNPIQAKDAISALNWSLTKSEKKRLDIHRNACLANMPQNPFTSP
ncbi:aldo/keto reductase [Prochlorococcus sp. MIT 0801]|uniref:aldo/keto reductase n=1 Tax=Prochlorococcus sp. MIT 0801 TaxID=1501269 RepID=UPI0004F921FF|nr:aldo/keto reductase [Prochlorococcus sp. MIT 0801]AIQ98200.1 Aldo/keto reductase family [Prochlorococcus sp. MIT 0801]